MLPSRPESPPRRASPRAGFTFVELAVAIAILTVAVGSLAATMLGTSALAQTNEQVTLAFEAAREAAEELRAAEFTQVFATYNSQMAASGFAVDGLPVRPGDADGLAGRFVFPEVVDLGVAQLCEAVDDAGLGMPRDLDSDGVVDKADHSGDYTLLPVSVLVEWQGKAGPQVIRVDTLLGRR